MNLIYRLQGTGTLLLGDQERKDVGYDIEVWEGDTGLKTARGTLSVTVQAGPCKLVLGDGSQLDLFVTTTGEHGSSVLVRGAPPENG